MDGIILLRCSVAPGSIVPNMIGPPVPLRLDDAAQQVAKQGKPFAAKGLATFDELDLSARTAAGGIFLVVRIATDLKSLLFQEEGVWTWRVV
jgi:hypothetical protein